MPAIISGGKGDAVASEDITRRGFGLDQIICRVGQKRRLCATVAVHLDAADMLVASAFIDVEPRPIELVGIVFAGDGSVGRLFLEGHGDGRKHVEHVLTFTAARHGSQIAPCPVRCGFDASRLGAVVEPAGGGNDFVVAGKVATLRDALGGCI